MPASSVFGAESLICQSLGTKFSRTQSFPLSGLGLTGIELNSGGFLAPVHIPTFDDILASDPARDDFLALFEGTGVPITG